LEVGVTAREAAFIALEEYRGGKPAEKAIGRMQEKCGIAGRDAAFAARLFKGVLQNMALLDYYASFFSSVDLKRIEPRALGILRISIYQLVFLTNIPSSAAVNEGVGLANNKMGKRCAGFVNAVLRKTAEAADRGNLPDIAGDQIKRLSIKYSHPEWLVREFGASIGRKGLESLLISNNEPDAPVTAQINTLLTNTETVTAMLAEDGLEAAGHDWLDGCIYFRGTGAFDRTEAFKKGYFYIQDAAARLAVMAACPEPGDYVIDGCAAPGGKSFAAAIKMRNEGRISAFDINAERLRMVGDGAKRLGIGIITAMQRDAIIGGTGMNGTRAHFLDVDVCSADVVFADVPCSGFGVIRRKPDIRYKTKREITGLPEIQGRILDGLSTCVKPGGVLLYSTCTVLNRENEGVIDGFIRRNSFFKPEGFTLPGVGEARAGMITLWPHIHGTDGFFICKLRKC